ncbi:MAG TPA: MJ0042-type zinc finger domain-containing protein [Mariprofundaceae bacterium]|nr:MJ0042-type zinc finger domain-containing protein [Mariprofundaceae bacterium]
MRIACPHCQAAYQIESAPAGAVFVCHRCGSEFSARDEETETPPGTPADEQLSLFGGQQDHQHPADTPPPETAPDTPADLHQPETAPAFDAADTVTYQAGLAAEDDAPKADNKHIWPWLVGVLIVSIIAGFWLQKDEWLDNRWFRSTAINLGLPLEMRDKDWRVIPESVHAQWIIRDDRSRALLIEGRVENLLASDLPAPKIEVTFFNQDKPDEILLSKKLEITLPPAMTTVRHAPFILPDRDIIPVSALGQRGFILLLESLPANTGDFALTARTSNRI